MKERKRFFDDRIWFDPKKNKIWIGRPDVKSGGEPWQWWITTRGEHISGKYFGPPKHFIEIARAPEFTICGGPCER